MPGPSTLTGSQFEIVSLGDFEMLAAAFNGLAAITSSDGFGNMMRVAFLVGILAFGLKVLLTGKFEATPLLASVILYFVMFVPKSQVIIVDAYSGGVKTVANVPVGLAAPFSLVSKTGRYFSQTFETAFSVIGPSSHFLGAGYLDALSVLLKMRDVSIGTANSDASNSGNLAASLQNYLVSCALFDIELASDTNSTINPEFLRKSGKIWDNLRTEFVNIHTIVYMPGSGVAGEDVSCRDAYLLIGSNYMNNGAWVGGAFDSYLKTVIQQPAGIDVPAGTRLQGALDSIGLASESAANYAINSVLYNAIRKAEAGYAASNGDINASITISQAENQRNVQWTAEKSMFEKVARPVTAFIEVFLVAATPLMAFAIAAFGVAGVTTLGKFLMMHFWVTLWAPTLTIANMYTFTVVNRFIAYTAAQVPPLDPLSINGIDQVTLGLQSQYATGCMLAAATPMLTLMLIYGSSQVASMLAHKMSSADQVDTKVASPPVVSPGALVHNQAGFTGNPVMGAGYGMTGAGSMSMSVSDIAIKGLTSAKQFAEEKTKALNESVGSTYTSSNAANSGLSMKDGKTLTNSQGEQNVLTASVNTARAATRSLGLSVSDSNKFVSAFSDTFTTGASGRVGTPEAFGISAGGKVDQSYVTQWANQHGIDVGQALQVAQQMSKQSTVNDSHAATLASMVSKTGEVATSKDVTRRNDVSDSASFQKTLGEAFKASDSLTTQQSYNQNIATAATYTPPQLLANVQGYAAANGVSARSVVDSAFSKAFNGDTQRQQQEFNRLMSNPLFQQNVASGDRETAAKAWIIATNNDANATHHLMAQIAPVSEGMTRRADASENMGLIRQASELKPPATAKALVGGADAGKLASQVDGKVAGGNAMGEGIRRQVNSGLPDPSAVKSRVLETSAKNDQAQGRAAAEGGELFKQVADKLTPNGVEVVFDMTPGSTAGDVQTKGDRPPASDRGQPTATPTGAGSYGGSVSPKETGSVPTGQTPDSAGIARPNAPAVGNGNNQSNSDSAPTARAADSGAKKPSDQQAVRPQPASAGANPSAPNSQGNSGSDKAKTPTPEGSAQADAKVPQNQFGTVSVKASDPRNEPGFNSVRRFKESREQGGKIPEGFKSTGPDDWNLPM